MVPPPKTLVPPPTADARIMLLAAPNANAAQAISRQLVRDHLAASVSIIPGVVNIERAEGELRETQCFQLLVKTKAEHVSAIEIALAKHSPNSPAECISLTPTSVERGYLANLLRSSGQRVSV